MLHKIKLPDCAPQLKRLTEIAEQVVIFALSNDLSILNNYTWDGSKQNELLDYIETEFIEKYGGHDLLAAVKECFLAHFTKWGQPKTGIWLWGKPGTIAAPIVKLIAIPVEQKLDLLEPFKHNIKFDYLLEGATSKCFVNPPNPNNISSEASKIIKGLLVNFYDKILVKDGIPITYVDENNEEDLLFNNKSILSSYHKLNVEFNVCPGCDGKYPINTNVIEQNDGQGTTIYNGNIDHFLPKSKYAFLSVHPLNLVPLCLECNQVRKGSRDPFDVKGVSDLDDIYHPYIRVASEEISVIIERNPINNEPCIKLYAPNIPHAQARLDSLNYLLKLESLWNGELRSENYKRDIVSLLGHILSDQCENNKQYDDDWFIGELNKLKNRIKRSDIGKIQGRIGSLAYLTWLTSDEKAYRDYGKPIIKALGIRIGSINPSDIKIHPKPVD